MKVKFYIKPIPNFLTKLTNKLSTSSRNEDNENIVKKDINIFEKQSKEIYTNSNTNTLFEFNIETLNNFENLTIASLKYSFSQSKNINPDSIILQPETYFDPTQGGSESTIYGDDYGNAPHTGLETIGKVAGIALGGLAAAGLAAGAVGLAKSKKKSDEDEEDEEVESEEKSENKSTGGVKNEY